VEIPPLKITRHFATGLVWLVVICLLSSCASSDVSRETTNQFDKGYINAKESLESPATGPADVFQNASQATRGALIGGAAGAITAALSSGAIGVIPGAATGAIFGAAYGSYIDAHSNRRDRLENSDVNIIVLGDQIRIVIPSARIFDGMSGRIRPQAYPTLTNVANYINQFLEMSVKVSSYADGMGTAMTNQALTQDQANSVARFLSDSNVNTRLIYGVGYGSEYPVVPFSGDWVDTDNYRTEITLEKLPA